MYRRLNTNHVLSLGLLLLFIMVTGQPVNDSDTWWHLKVGEFIWESQTIPKVDFFSFSNEGHPWITHEWFSEVLYYLAYYIGDFQGMFVLNLLILSAIFYGYYKLVKSRSGGNSNLIAAFLFICPFFTFFFWVFRPHLIAHLFFVVFVYVLTRFWEGQDRLWVLPLLMVVWVNAHGSFIMGPLLIFLYMMGGIININHPSIESRQWSAKEKKKIIFVLALCIVAAVINPNTYHILTYPLDTVNSSYITDQINEWSSPDFHEPYLLLFLVYVLSFFLVAALGFRRHRLPDILTVGLLSVMSFYAVRNIPLFMYVSGPVFAYYMAGAFNGEARGKGSPGKEYPDQQIPDKQIPLLNWVVLCGMFAAIVFYWPPKVSIDDYANKKNMPVEAVNFLQERNLRGKVFNDYNWGGYLLWRTYPANKVMIDGRTDIYADKVYPDYLRIIRLKENAYSLLMAYQPDIILIPKGTPLDTYLRNEADWEKVYSDTLAVIYLPASGQPASILSKEETQVKR